MPVPSFYTNVIIVLNVVFLTAKIVTPSGRTHLPDIVDNGDGSVTIKYQPTEVGLHNLHVAYNGKPIEGNNIHTL